MDKPSGINSGTLVNVALIGGLALGVYKVGESLNWWGDKGQGGGGNTDPRVDPELPPPTMSYNAARILADEIYFALYGDGSFWTGAPFENEEAVIAAMIVPRNENDVLQLIDAYGIRSGVFATTGPLNLIAALEQYLEPADRARINQVYISNGINIRIP
jgi:hypothetical protein